MHLLLFCCHLYLFRPYQRFSHLYSADTIKDRKTLSQGCLLLIVLLARCRYTPCLPGCMPDIAYEIAISTSFGDKLFDSFTEFQHDVSGSALTRFKNRLSSWRHQLIDTLHNGYEVYSFMTIPNRYPDLAAAIPEDFLAVYILESFLRPASQAESTSVTHPTI